MSHSSGSSPRLRGTRVAHSGVRGCARFIPAPAGNTGRGRARMASAAVHPRACGEHASFIMACRASCGSSPRLRGTRSVGNHIHAGSRFIPAPAGNTLAACSTRRLKTVHPRACGEHARCRGGGRRARGSSPRLRGTRSHVWVCKIVDRFIPAPAGNTQQAARSPHAKAVHPRACGEHTIRRNSPYKQPRFIPAPAGNTYPDGRSAAG